MSRDRSRYLGFVRRLALLGPVVVGCAAPGPPVAATTKPEATAPSASAASTASTAKEDPTTPCRCAWDTDAASAPRVCADREIDHAGEACVRGADHSTKTKEKIYLPPVVGPLPPPDLTG